VLCLSAAIVSLGIAKNTDFSLQLFSDESLAKCLDGSPAGFYYRLSPTGSSSWLVYFLGGAYCVTLDDCVARSHTDLGSSANWTSFPTDTFDAEEGLFSTDPIVNPDFHDWNMARIQYCDGYWYAGDRVEPVSHNGTDLFFRGRYIVEDSIKTLMEQFNLSNADQIIISGCSSGGMSVYLHLDWIREQIPSHIPVVGTADSGYFLDVPNYKGQCVYHQIYENCFEMQNATFVDSDCLAAMSPENQYKCSAAVYGAPFVQTPLFVMNSLSDVVQLELVLELDCLQRSTLQNCSEAELTALANFRLTMINELKNGVLNKPANGAFLPSCLSHCGACKDPFWENTTVQGVQLSRAFGDWYFRRPNTFPILIDGPWPSKACENSND